MTRIARIATAAAAALGCAQLASAGSVNVFLDADHQGGEGNKGASFRPVDESGDAAAFLVTARTSIDDADRFSLDATGLSGTVYLEKDDTGLGVQTGDFGGSKGISGGGGDKDEELIFTFDNPTLATDLRVGLNDFKPGNGLDDGDDPILFINVAGGPDTLMLDETDFLTAFTFTGSETGILDFGLLGLGANALIDSFAIRETKDHLFVNMMAYGEGGGTPTPIPLPAPLLLGLAGLAGVAALRRRGA